MAAARIAPASQACWEVDVSANGLGVIAESQGLDSLRDEEAIGRDVDASCFTQ
jgi:hypothetical protein